MFFKKNSLNLACITLVFLVVNVSSEIYFKKGSPHVKLSNGGILSGSLKFSREGRPFSSFEGVPYATVPERFAESELIKKAQWEGALSVTKPGAMCAQKMGLPTPASMGEEDCLFLNVYVPMNNTGKKGYPVMVWIHGGGFAAGSSDMFGGPQYFLDEDVVLVSINYRLGVFGFLSTGDEVIPGNLGLKDQVNALRWVQENIKNFGGNPGKVTIFGESAGAASVHYLILSPMAKGLFHGAIAQSGSALSPWAYTKYPKESAVALATHLNCPTTAPNPAKISSQEILTCLKGKSKEELQSEFKKSWPTGMLQLVFVPTSEPEATAGSSRTPFITQSPWSILQAKDKRRSISDVPLIFGANKDEMYAISSMIMSDPSLVKEMNGNWEEHLTMMIYLDNSASSSDLRKVVSDKVKEFYFGSKQKEITQDEKDKDGLSSLYNDAFISYSVLRAAVETASRGTKKTAPVYLYRFDYPTLVSFMAVMIGSQPNPTKVDHADELILQFDNSGLNPAMAIKPDSDIEDFSKKFIRLWTSFAKHGEPEHVWGNSNSARWNPISKEEASGSQPLKWYKLNSTPEFVEICDQIIERTSFWNQIWDEHLSPLSDEEKRKTEL